MTGGELQRVDDTSRLEPVVPSAGVVAIPIARNKQKTAWGKPKGTSLAWAGDVPAIVQAFQRGNDVRIVGPQHLIDGIANGSLQLTRDGDTFTGLVRGTDGRFAGHLRFEEVGWVQSAAMTGFQLASAITLQYYLHEINARLDRVLRQVAATQQFLEARADAELDAAELLIDRTVGRLVHQPWDDTVAAELANARRDVEVGRMHARRLVEEAAPVVAAARAAYEEASTNGRMLAPLFSGGQRKRILEALEAVGPAGRAGIRLLRATELSARLDVLQALRDDDAAAAYLRMRNAWVRVVADDASLLDRIAVLRTLDDAGVRSAFLGDGKLLRGLDDYRATIDGLVSLHATTRELLTAPEASVGAIDLVSHRGAIVGCPVKTAEV